MSDNFNSVQPGDGYQQVPQGQPMSQPSGVPMSQPSGVPMSQPSGVPMSQPSAQQWSYQTGPIPQMQMPTPQDTAFARLFDFTFSRYAVEKAANIFYILVLVTAGIYAISGLVHGITTMDINAFSGLLEILLSIASAAVMIMVARFFLENCLANVRKEEATKGLLTKLGEK